MFNRFTEFLALGVSVKIVKITGPLAARKVEDNAHFRADEPMSRQFAWGGLLDCGHHQS